MKDDGATKIPDDRIKQEPQGCKHAWAWIWKDRLVWTDKRRCMTCGVKEDVPMGRPKFDK